MHFPAMLAPWPAALVAVLLTFPVSSHQAQAVDPYKKVGKPEMIDSLLELKSRYEPFLGHQSFTWGPWDADFIPEDCEYFAKKTGVSPEHMVVHNVTYSDCPDPWFMCFHQDVPEHAGLADIFGRLPVHMRSWVKHLVAFPKSSRPRLDKGAHQMATQSQGNIVLWGPEKTWLDVLIHQAAHSLDLNGGYGQALSSKKGLSSSGIWHNAVENDRMVPSKRSRENSLENVAENTVTAIYFRALGVHEFAGTYPKEPPAENEDPRRLRPKPCPCEPLSQWEERRFNSVLLQQDLLKAVDEEVHDKGGSFFAPGGRCTLRIAPSPLIPVKRDGAPRYAPESELGPGIEVVTLPPPGTRVQYECPYFDDRKIHCPSAGKYFGPCPTYDHGDL